MLAVSRAPKHFVRIQFLGSKKMFLGNLAFLFLRASQERSGGGAGKCDSPTDSRPTTTYDPKICLSASLEGSCITNSLAAASPALGKMRRKTAALSHGISVALVVGRGQKSFSPKKGATASSFPSCKISSHMYTYSAVLCAVLYLQVSLHTLLDNRSNLIFYT